MRHDLYQGRRTAGKPSNNACPFLGLDAAYGKERKLSLQESDRVGWQFFFGIYELKKKTETTALWSLKSSLEA